MRLRQVRNLQADSLDLKEVKWGREPGIFLCRRELRVNKQTSPEGALCFSRSSGLSVGELVNL